MLQSVSKEEEKKNTNEKNNPQNLVKNICYKLLQMESPGGGNVCNGPEELFRIGCSSTKTRN